MAEEGLLVRSEAPTIKALSETLNALKRSENPQEIGDLVSLAFELYADASCRCEEKAAAYGDGSDEVKDCDRNVNRGREEIKKAITEIVRVFKGG